jgi:hypothetical protein
MGPDELRMTIREKLAGGTLPREKCQVTWFGPGTGQRCVACERLIGRQEIECECEQSTSDVLRFHQACFATWDDERQDTAGALTP